MTTTFISVFLFLSTGTGVTNLLSYPSYAICQAESEKLLARYQRLPNPEPTRFYCVQVVDNPNRSR